MLTVGEREKERKIFLAHVIAYTCFPIPIPLFPFTVRQMTHFDNVVKNWC